MPACFAFFFRLTVAALLLAASPVISAQPDSPHATSTAETQHWKGTIELPGGMKLDFTVSLGDSGGTISIPMQGAKDLALREGTTDGRSLKFTLAPPGAAENAWAKFDLTISDDGETAEGTLSQVGQQFPVQMTRITAAEAEHSGLKRPQTPKPPFPYEERQVEFRNETGGVTIAGTLTVPREGGPHPAVVLITGSGAQDRDETILGHKPFLVWADYLTRRGIAVLRTDDRGVGGTGGNLMLAKEEDIASDAAAGVAFLKSQPGIDPSRLGVMGHSEGAALAPLVAATSGDVRFVVMLAGYACKGSELLRIQTAAIMRSGGIKDDALIAAVLDAHRAAMDAVTTNASADEGLRRMTELIKTQMDANGTEITDEDAMQQARQQYPAILTPWFRSFLAFDPAESLRLLRVPVLAIFGERDLQVPPKDTLPAIRSAIEEAGNNDATIKEMPALNHLFQTCETGALSEYGLIEETISPAALELVTTWIRKKAGLN